MTHGLHEFDEIGSYTRHVMQLFLADQLECYKESLALPLGQKYNHV